MLYFKCIGGMIMNFKLFLFISLLFIAGCSLSEEEVIEETIDTAEDTNNYELEISTEVERENDADVYSMEIDRENNEGLIIMEAAERNEEFSTDIYYDNENVYEKNNDGPWQDSEFSSDEMHTFYFVDYQTIAEILEYIGPLEETTFEETENTYEFSYQTTEEDDTSELLEKWGFDIGHDETFSGAYIELIINQDTFHLEEVALEYTVEAEDGTRETFLQTLKYGNINELGEIERPEEI